MPRNSDNPGFGVQRITIALLLAACLTIHSTVASEGDAATRIDQIMASRYPKDEPGAVALAARQGEVVLRRAYGLANLELQVPVQPEMVFGLASVTKVFTAVAALKLVDQGKLRLDEKVVDYLPNLTNTKGVTIAHLMSHTSGMTGPAAEVPGYRVENIHREVTSEDLVATYADFPLLFEPGERYKYSNEGMATLARIVEIASEQSWEDFLRQHIFEPAGMRSTYYGGHRRVIPQAVSGYTQQDDGWRQARQVSLTRGFGMGGLFSTVDDLFAFHNALIAGNLVKPKTLEAMLTPYPLIDGGHSRYGYGFVVVNRSGNKFVGHGGALPGMSTFVGILPEHEVFVTVLTSRTPRPIPAREAAEAILDVLVGTEHVQATQSDHGAEQGSSALPPMLARFDTDGDGRVSEAEAPPRLKGRFSSIDTNRDGHIDTNEANAMRQRMGR